MLLFCFSSGQCMPPLAMLISTFLTKLHQEGALLFLLFKYMLNSKWARGKGRTDHSACYCVLNYFTELRALWSAGAVCQQEIEMGHSPSQWEDAIHNGLKLIKGRDARQKWGRVVVIKFSKFHKTSFWVQYQLFKNSGACMLSCQGHMYPRSEKLTKTSTSDLITEIARGAQKG